MTDRTVTVRLPETLYRQARETAAASSMSLEEVLARSIALSLPPLEDDLPLDLRQKLSALMLLGDDDLWHVASLELDEDKQDKLEILTEIREQRPLTPEEDQEFDILMVEGEFLMVKKAEAYRLLTRRGFSIPWLSE